MVYQGRFETNLLQLFARTEKSKRFSIISVNFFGGKIVSEQKKA